MPARISCNAASIKIIAFDTNVPNAEEYANNVIALIVNPLAPTNSKPAINDAGITTPAITVERQFLVNANNTNTVNTTPKIIPLIVSFVSSEIAVEESDIISMFVSTFGKCAAKSAFNAGNFLRKAFDILIALPSFDFSTDAITTSVPLKRAPFSISRAASRTDATSDNLKRIPSLVDIGRFAISFTLANSPIKRTLFDVVPYSILPPGTLRFLFPSAVITSIIVTPRAAIRSGSISTRIARSRPPNVETLATPSISVIWFAKKSSTYCLISSLDGPRKTTSTTACCRGFNFSTTGCFKSSGNCDAKLSIFVLISAALSFAFTPKLNSVIIYPPFSKIRDVICFTPGTSDIASSAFLITWDSISSLDAPGYTNVAVTIGKSNDGVRSMLIFGYATNPNSTQTKTNINVVTGRRTKNFNIL